MAKKKRNEPGAPRRARPGKAVKRRKPAAPLRKPPSPKKKAAKKTAAKRSTPKKKAAAKAKRPRSAAAKKRSTKPTAKASAKAKRPAIARAARGAKAAANVKPAATAAPPHAALLAVDVAEAEQEALRSKFELGPHEWTQLLDAREKTQTIPWGYGRDRVTAMAVDPDSLFIYWEVTDDSLAAARERLARSESGQLVLRVHDVTDLLFDGSNAHHSFDLAIGRADRQRFHHIGRPTSSVIVELGLVGDDGRFAAIARSHRVDFPRRDPAPSGPVDWLTVREVKSEPRSDRLAITPAPAPSRSGGAGGASPLVADAPRTSPQREDASGQGAIDDARVLARATPTETTFAWDFVTEITEDEGDLESSGLEAGTLELTDGGELTTGSMAPFEDAATFGPGEWELDVPAAAVVVTRSGGAPIIERRGTAWRVREAPWSVEIRGIGARGGRRVLARWELYRVRAVSAGRQRIGERRWFRRALAAGALAAGASEPRLAAGASERRWLAASELRLRGASEERFAGASEARRGGKAASQFDAGSEARLAAAKAPSQSPLPPLPPLPPR